MLDTVREQILNILKVYDSYTAIVDEIDDLIDRANEKLHERYPNYLILRYGSYIYLKLMDGDLPLRQLNITYDVLNNLNSVTNLKYKLFNLIEKGLV